MRYYPAYLDIQGKKAVIIGAGKVAARKADLLISAKAEVTVVSPAFDSMFDAIRPELKGIRQKKYEASDIDGAFIVIAATDSPDINRQIAADAKKIGALVNVITPPEESGFIVPSVIEKGDIIISVSTSGASPGLSKRIRKELEEIFGEEYTLFGTMIGNVRKVLQEKVDPERRPELLNEIVNSDILDMLKNKNFDIALEKLAHITGIKFDIDILNKDEQSR